MRESTVKTFFIKHNLVLVLLALFSLMAILFHEVLFTRGVLQSFLHMTTILGLLTIGQSLVLITGGIDLSNGTLIALTSVLAATVALNNGTLAIISITFIVCALIGCLSGTLIVKADFPPLIATLVAMGVAEGITFSLTRGSPLELKNELMGWFGVATITGIPLYSVVWIGLMIVVYLVLTKTLFGRHIYAVGGSEKSANRCGINVKKTKFSVYLISALLAWLAGVLYACYTGAGAPRAGGFHYMLDSASAAIIGGIALSGGRGNILDAMLGAMFFTLLYITVIFLRISPILEGAFRGALLLIVVLYAYFRGRPQQ